MPGMFEEPYELLLGPSDCCEAVVVDYDQEKHARRPHALDDLIDETWARALDAKPNLFDGAKFRLASASSSSGTATLRIGLTGYREYVGTNRAPHWERLAGDGGAHLSNALGCETHAFDPTKGSRFHHELHAFVNPNVSFHYMGLGARRGGTASGLVSSMYGELGGPILALDDLMGTLNQTNRQIDLLKFDCEGCEWEALVDVAQRAPSVLSRVCTFIFEIHVTTTLQMFISTATSAH